MERAVYFDGWFPNHYCYHPSMPPRRLAMLTDLESYGATMLVWAGLGGGSISLPYLEQEAYEQVPARFRQHGFVNDAEFIAHAKRSGIDLFAIVFEAQAWEFPAELSDGEVVAQNELRGAGTRGTVGLREFSTDTGPASWKPFRHYFPDGLTNSSGEPVTDLWEEVTSRDLEGRPLHAHWVEVGGGVDDPDGQQCRFADRNNPVWREYLKAVIRTQIDAGAPGIQLDESDTPLNALRYGGCFCADCVRLFREYLIGLPADRRPAELDGVDLATFDYRSWLLARGHRGGENPRGLPLYDQYVRAQVLALPKTFADVARYARSYAARTGREVRVSGNFYDCSPVYDAMVDEVDILITEMRETGYQQPWYFRHGVGLARGKPLVAVENPYGGVTEELLNQLRAGRGYDRFRLSIYEASAMGANMALPYGSWLGTEVRDSYWAPQRLTVETGQFLASIDPLISAESAHTTAVVYSVAGMLPVTIDSDQFFDGDRFFPQIERDQPPASYWPTIEALSRAGRTYDVLVFPDEELRPTDLTPADLGRYRTVVLPDLWAVSPTQHGVIREYLAAGGRVVLHGRYGDLLPDAERRAVVDHAGTTVVAGVADIAAHTTDVVEADLGPQAAVAVHALADGSRAVHLLNYDYDGAADRVRPRPDLAVTVRTGTAPTRAVVHRPGADPTEIPVRHVDGDRWSFTVPELGAYAVVQVG